MALHARTIIAALDMSKDLNTINTYTNQITATDKLSDAIITSWQTTSRDATHYTTYKNHTSIQLAVTKVASFHPHYLTFTLQTYHHPEHRFRSCMAYEDDIQSHLHTQARMQQINIYKHTYIKFFVWTNQNNVTLNPNKTTCILFTPDHAEYTSNLDPKINNTALHMPTHPKFLRRTLDPKLTYSTHIHNISVHAQTPLQIIKAHTATGWGKQKETLMATYKAVMIPALEYASSIWSPLVSWTSINKLQVLQNAALRTDTGYTQDTSIHLHDETPTLPMHEHLQLHGSQYKQKTQHLSHPLHKYTTYLTLQGKTLSLTTAVT